ncbi:hypothetical protein K9L16_02345 [Candidatus Pacearchaeota archaeon]|nr:hypothetical protein [Candidatus Pacearchaeota archaeon]
MNKKLFFILIMIFCVFYISENISALGITPGRTTIEFESGLQKQVEVKITNAEKKAVDVLIYTRGELSNLINLPFEKISFAQGESEKIFVFDFTLPSNQLEPGLHTAEIIVAEVPEDSEEEGAVIGASVAVATQLHVRVPYPGKYIEFDLSVVGSSSEGITSFIIPIINRGQQNINEISGKIEIYSLDNQKLDEISLSGLSIKAGERREITANWNTNVTSGRYKARVILDYDGSQKTLEKEFNVGEAKLSIDLITVKDFKLGGIAKFNIIVSNKFGSEIKNVFVNMLIYGTQGETLADIKTPNYDISGMTKKEMNAFWDTEGIKEGIYDGKLSLNYEEKKDEQNIRINVEKDKIQVLGMTGEVIVEGDTGFDLTNILIIIIILLILSNIIWFFAAKRKKQKNSDK